MAKMDNLKKNMLKLYKSWQGKGVFSLAFDEHVYFTLLGWNHIVGNAGKHRSLADVYRRLRLLPF